MEVVSLAQTSITVSLSPVRSLSRLWSERLYSTSNGSPGEECGSLKFTHSSKVSLPWCHLGFPGKLWAEDLKLAFSLKGLTVVRNVMWTEMLRGRQKGVSWNFKVLRDDLTLLGSDGAQLLLKIWDGLSLGDLRGFLDLAEELHHSWGPALNPRVLWGETEKKNKKDVRTVMCQLC